LQPVAFFLDFLLAVVEELSLMSGVTGEFFVAGFVGFFVAVLFHVLFLGVKVDRATAAPGVLFDFLASPTSFFAFFLWSVVVSPDFAFVLFSAFFVSPSFVSRD
jgi:cbb3-type cytochrome oxidase subunit 3